MEMERQKVGINKCIYKKTENSEAFIGFFF